MEYWMNLATEHWVSLAPIWKALIWLGISGLAALAFWVLTGNKQAGFMGAVPFYVLGVFVFYLTHTGLTDLMGMLMPYLAAGLLAAVIFFSRVLLARPDTEPNHHQKEERYGNTS